MFFFIGNDNFAHGKLHSDQCLNIILCKCISEWLNEGYSDMYPGAALLFYVKRPPTSHLSREMPSRHYFSHVFPLDGIRNLSKSNCTKEKLNCIHRFNRGTQDIWRAHNHWPWPCVLVYSHSIYGKRSDCGGEEPVQHLSKSVSS